MKTHLRLRGLALLALSLLLTAPAAPAAQDDAARWLPPDTFFYVQLTSATDIQAHFKKHSLWALYKDPAMQPVVAQATETISTKLDEALQKFWTQEMKMTEPPKSIPWPTGRVLMAARATYRSETIEDYDYENFDWQSAKPGEMPPVKSKRQIQRMSPQFLVIAEMGDSAEPLRAILTQATAKMVEEGAKRSRQTVRGVEIDVLEKKPAGAGAEPSKEESSQPPEVVAFGFKGQTFIGASDVKLVEDVLARMGDSSLESLADDVSHKQVMRTVEAPGDLSVYVNLRLLLPAALSSRGDSAFSEKIMRTLGLENVKGAGLVFTLAPNEALDAQVKGFILVPGERTGIPALLSVPSAPTDPPPLAGSGLYSVFVANYDLGKVFDRIVQMVQPFVPMDVTQAIQKGMESLAEREAGGRPAMNFRQDVLGQTAAPLIVSGRYDPARPKATHADTLICVAARNAELLESAVGRLHASMGGADKELRREMLGTTIYLLPMTAADVFPDPAARGGDGEGIANKAGMAFAVTGNCFVLGPENAVDQAVRETHSQEPTSLKSDPVFRHTARSLPGEAAAWYYMDRRQEMERLWQGVRAAAKVASTQPAQTEDEGFEAISRNARANFLTLSSADVLVKAVRPLCNLGLLPEFSSVQQYFGPACGYLKSTEEGIYFEASQLKAPK